MSSEKTKDWKKIKETIEQKLNEDTEDSVEIDDEEDGGNGQTGTGNALDHPSYVALEEN